MSLFNELIAPVVRPFAAEPKSTAACATACASNATPEVTLRPACRIEETPAGWNLTVHLPGVAREGLEFTAEDGLLVIRGRRALRTPEGWTPLRRETTASSYELTLTHDEAVDTSRIEAALKDGVLKVTLPKAESQKARKISIN